MRWQDIILWVLFILSVTLALFYLFGNSPTFEQTLLVMIITFLFKINYDLTINTAETKNLKVSFIRLVNDFKNHIDDKIIHKKK